MVSGRGVDGRDGSGDVGKQRCGGARRDGGAGDGGRGKPGGLALPVTALAVALALVLSLTFRTGVAGVRWTVLDGWGLGLVRAALEAFPGLGKAMHSFMEHAIFKMGVPVLALVGIWATCLAEGGAARRAFLARSLLGLVLALALGQGMQHLL